MLSWSEDSYFHKVAGICSMNTLSGNMLHRNLVFSCKFEPNYLEKFRKNV